MDYYTVDDDTLILYLNPSRELGIDVNSSPTAELFVSYQEGIAEVLLDREPLIGLKEEEVLALIRSENVFANYKAHEIDEAANITYVGNIHVEGRYLMQKLVDTSGDLEISYANLSNNPAQTTFSLAWTNRAILNYTLISNLTGV